MKKTLFFILASIASCNIFCQEEKGLVQFTGRVFNEYLQPLKYAHIVVSNRGEGTISDREGKFSFVVREHDSIHFSSMGFKSSVVIIPDSLEKPFFTRDVLMQSDTITIPEIEVYPWHDYQEFKEAFLNLELPEDDLAIARKNIANIKAQMVGPSSGHSIMMQKQFDDISNRGMTPTYQIFNVFAWSKFIKAIKNGDFKNHSKD